MVESSTAYEEQGRRDDDDALGYRPSSALLALTTWWCRLLTNLSTAGIEPFQLLRRKSGSLPDNVVSTQSLSSYCRWSA